MRTREKTALSLLHALHGQVKIPLRFENMKGEITTPSVIGPKRQLV